MMNTAMRRGYKGVALLILGLFILAACDADSAAANLATAADGPVQVWLTTPDRGSLLEPQADLAFGDSPAGDTITVDPNGTRQVMDGFGASITDSSASLLYQLSPERRSEVMRSIFDPEEGIGMSFLRQPIAASDFVDGPHYTYNDIPENETDFNMERFSIARDEEQILPLLREAIALNPDLKVMASPWGQPAWMKVDGVQYGGRLKDAPAVIDAYALYLVKFVEAYADAGVPIYALTVQNEPQNVAPDGYPGTDMPVAVQADVINALAPMLAEAGFGDVKIIGFDHNWELFPGDPSDEPDYPFDLLRTDAAPNIDGTGYHCYAGDPSAQSALHNEFPDKDIWFTECSGFRGFDDSQAKAFADTLNFHAQNITLGTTRNWAKAVVNWNLALDNNGTPVNGGCGVSPDGVCTGAIGINGTDVQYNAEYFNLGHMSKFVKPGAVYLESNTVGDVINSAFRNPDNSIALVAHNASRDSEQAISVSYEGSSFNYTLSANSLVTFVWNGDAGGTTGGTDGATDGATDDGGTDGTATTDGGTDDGGDTGTDTGTDDGGTDDTTDGTDGGTDAGTDDGTDDGGTDGGADGPLDPSRFYQVVNVNSDKCVDAAGFGTSNGTALQQWTCSSPAGDNQAWQFEPTSGGYYQVVSKQAPIVWDIEGGTSATQNGRDAQLWAAEGGENQQWRPVDLGNGTYSFEARHSDKCLDVRDMGTGNGARLQQWECTQGPAQVFQLR